MLQVPIPDADERRDNAAFKAVRDALARPGLVRTLPEPGPLVVARALIDRECRVAVHDPDLRREVAALGPTLVPPELADHAFDHAGDAAALARLARLPAGSALYPEAGATAILTATLDGGTRLRLGGPGVDGRIEVALGGVVAGFWAMRAAACRYPLGIDLLIVDGARLLGLPRSTDIEVL